MASRIGLALDRGLSIVAPRKALHRMAARARIEAMAGVFEAAQRTPQTRDWPAERHPLDRIVDEQIPVMARARDAVRNTWAGRALVRAYKRQVVGTGITARHAARDADGAPLDDFNRRVDEAWEEWTCRSDLVDLEQRKTFLQVQHMAVSELVTVGHAMILERVDGRSRNPLRLQVMPAERLAHHLSTRPREGVNRMLGGLEIDSATGATVAFHFMRDELSHETVRVPASRVMHVFDQDVPFEPFSPSWLTPILVKIRHLLRYDEAQLIRARLEATIGAVIEQSLPEGSDDEFGALPSTRPIKARDESKTLDLNFEPGMVWQPPPGHTVKFNTPSTPGGTYDPYVTKQISEIAAGAGQDFAELTRDFSRGNFSSQRQGMLVRHEEIGAIQSMMIDRFLRPVRSRFITLAALAGVFPDDQAAAVLAPESRGRMLRTDWRPPARPWIDPMKQVKASYEAVNHGFANQMTINNELGQDWREIERQRLDEIKFRIDEAEKRGIPLALAFSGPQAALAAAEDEEEEGDDDA